MDGKDKPAGVDYIWSGDMENQQEGFGTLGYCFISSYYLSLFGNGIVVMTLFVYPFVVLFSIPWR